MIVHYVVAHGYRPPDAFCAAVLAHRPANGSEHAEALRAICPTFPPYVPRERSEVPAWPTTTLPWHARLRRWLRR